MNTQTENSIAEGFTINRGKRIWMAIILGSLSALAPLTTDMYLPALPTLAENLQASTSMIQLSLLVSLLGLALGQLIAGPISDARGRRIPLLIGMLIFSISSLLCAFSTSITTLIIFRFIQGLAGSAGLVISRAIVRDHFSGTEMTKFFAMLILVNGIAPIVSPVIGGQLLRFTSWQGIFVVHTILGIFLLLGVFLGMPESLQREKCQKGGVGKTLTSMRCLLGDRLFMGYILSSGLVLAAMFAYISGSPFVLQVLYGLSPQAFSAIFGINSLGIIIAGQFSSRLCIRIGEKKMLSFGLGIAGCASLILLVMIQIGAGLVAVLIPLFFVVASVGIVGPPSTSLAMQEQGNNAGSASAMIGLAQMGIGALITPLVGLGGSHTALPMGLVIACCDVGAILCFILLAKGFQHGSALKR